jgi:hypothetical protein
MPYGDCICFQRITLVRKFSELTTSVIESGLIFAGDPVFRDKVESIDSRGVGIDPVQKQNISAVDRCGRLFI